jgi:hypothetical protein
MSPRRSELFKITDEERREVERWSKRTGLDFTQLVNEALEGDSGFKAAREAAIARGGDAPEITKRFYVRAAIAAALQEVREMNALAAGLN